MRFIHCTRLGALFHKQVMNGLHAMIKVSPAHDGDADSQAQTFKDVLPFPDNELFLTPERFGGVVETGSRGWIDYMERGRIQVLPGYGIKSVTQSGVVFRAPKGATVAGQELVPEVAIQCGAIVAATGYQGKQYNFLDSDMRADLGLTPVAPGDDSAERFVKAQLVCTLMVQGPKAAKDVAHVPAQGARLCSRRHSPHLPGDRAVWQAPRARSRHCRGQRNRLAGPLRFSLTNQLQDRSWVPRRCKARADKQFDMLEVEAHWISSSFKGDASLMSSVPKTVAAAKASAEADNDYRRARHIELSSKASLITACAHADRQGVVSTSSLFLLFRTETHIRDLCRDLGVNPWRHHPAVSSP